MRDERRPIPITLTASEKRAIERRVDGQDLDAVRRTMRCLSHGARAAAELERIRRIWSTTNLPLADWASGISEVAAQVDDNDARIAVFLAQPKGWCVTHYAPLAADEAVVLVRNLPKPTAELCLDLLYVCPGLSLERQGYLLHDGHLRQRMAYVAEWVNNMRPYADQWAERDAEFPDPRRYACEIMITVLGDAYVIDLEGGLAFFDHEECEFTPCAITLDELVVTYFVAPYQVLAPEKLGWLVQ